MLAIGGYECVDKPSFLYRVFVMASPVKKIIFRLSLSFCIASVAAGFLFTDRVCAETARYVRVAILKDINRMRLKISGFFELSNALMNALFLIDFILVSFSFFLIF